MHNRRAKKKLTLGLDESGAVAVIAAITLSVLCGFAALALDFVHMIMVKAELQRTADAATLAGAMGLLPYNNPGPNQTPNWVQGQQTAHGIINNAANSVYNDTANNARFSITEGTVLYGYWCLKPPPNYVQLQTVRPTNSAYLPEPAINVTLSRNVTLYLAPVVGVSSPKTVSATATAILPEAYQTSHIPPIAVPTMVVYNNVGNNIVINVAEQDLKIQSQKNVASWFNLDGLNDVPTTRIDKPITTCSTPIYMQPGAKATLTDFITQGDTIVLPVVQDVMNKSSQQILDWCAFKVDILSSNSMEGHFVNRYFDPHVVPTAGTGTIGGVAGTPELVSP